MRAKILKLLYKAFPFDLKGDCELSPATEGIKFSCLINFYGRLDLLSGILCSLAAQDFPRESFEVVLVEDQGGTDAGKEMAEQFSEQLPIRYFALTEGCGKIGHGRNFSLSKSVGENIIFLDDDTVLLQKDFLSTALKFIEQNPNCDAVIPTGNASWFLIEGRYGYHDKHFMTNRCMIFRRSVMLELGGLMSEVVGQEDVEFVFRFIMAGKKSSIASGLAYYHPPLLVANSNKGKAVGASFYRLKGRYSWPIWVLVLVNCSRHVPLRILPMRHCQQMGRFACGFVLGVWDSVIGKKDFRYS